MGTRSAQSPISSPEQSQSTSDSITLEQLPEDYTPSAIEAETIQATSYSSPTSSVDDASNSTDSDDAVSDTGTGVTQRFRDLQCDDKLGQQERSQGKSQHNATLVKRTYSQSVEDEEDVQLTLRDNFMRKSVPRKKRRRIGRPMSGEWVQEVSDGDSHNHIKSAKEDANFAVAEIEDVKPRLDEETLSDNAMEVD